MRIKQIIPAPNGMTIIWRECEHLFKDKVICLALCTDGSVFPMIYTTDGIELFEETQLIEKYIYV
jgi:hypothetical protein